MIIYKVTNKINNKIYIGRTKHSLKKRKKQHEHLALNLKIKANEKGIFKNALRKYGLRNFVWEILENLSNEDELIKKESFYINKFKSYDRQYGYNISKTGFFGGDVLSNHPNKKGIYSKRDMSKLKTIEYKILGIPIIFILKLFCASNLKMLEKVDPAKGSKVTFIGSISKPLINLICIPDYIKVNYDKIINLFNKIKN